LSLKQSSIHWFATISCKTVTRGLPSSLSQLQTLPAAMFSQHTVSSITSPNHGTEADFVTQYHFSSPTSGQLQISPYQLAPPVKAFIFFS
jgi:hypothetical protein